MQSHKDRSLWQRHGKSSVTASLAFTTLVLLSPGLRGLGPNRAIAATRN